MHSPLTPVEGLIDGIVTPTVITPRPGEEADEPVLQQFSEQGDHQRISISPEVPVDVDSLERSIVQEAKRLSPRPPEDDRSNSMHGRGVMGGISNVPMSYNGGGNSMMGVGMGVGMGMDRQPYPPMNGYGNYSQGYGNAPPRCMY